MKVLVKKNLLNRPSWNALKKKLEANLNDRLKLRETEHNKLLQRYQNVKKEIENQQNIERIKFEKAFQNSNTRP